MSGIAGLYHLDGCPADRNDLEGMVTRMAHRGPDGVGIWLEGAVGLGHLMLATTPVARQDRQPLVHKAGDLAVTADARLDNRAELKARLHLSKRDVTDGELILAAYEAWGEACPEQLLGAFAFVLWDGRNQRLFCARDHFGVRPLYYSHVPGRCFVVASEIKALFQCPAVSAALDDAKIAEHLLVPVTPDVTRTYYRDVRAVAPGHSVTVTTTGVAGRQYYDLDPSRELRLSSDGEYAEAFRAHFAEAVRCRMGDGVATGAMLSGGLDSTSIACMAATLVGSGAAIPTFSAIFDAVPESDEREYQQAAIDRYHFPAHILHADRESPLSDLEDVCRALDRPNFGANLYIHWHLQRRAGGQGVRVLLDGFDGDTTVSHGRGYFYELKARGRLLKLAREVKAYAVFAGYPWPAVVRHWVRGALLERLFAVPGVSGLRQVRRRLRGTSNTPPPLPVWQRTMAPDFAERVDAWIVPPPPKPKTERLHHYQLLQQVCLTEGCEMLNMTASAFGVEPRFPFFDRRLIEFCLSLPPEQKMRRGYPRYILRNAMTDVLPEEVQWRGKKADISPSFLYGFRRYGRQAIEELIRQDVGEVGRYVNLEFFRDVGRRFLDGTEQGDRAVMLWRALTLALWLARKTPPDDRGCPAFRVIQAC